MRHGPGAAWTRRGFLSLAASAMAARSAAAARAVAPAARVQEEFDATLDRDAIGQIARAVHPQQLPDAARVAEADDFLAWVRGYRADAEMDHGYGFTRLRRTAPHPADAYRADLLRLDAAAREAFDDDFSRVEASAARSLIEADLEAFGTELRDLPSRPAGEHVVIDVIAQWARSAGAADLCYEAEIRRETCRGLFVDLDGPPPLGETEGR